MILTSIKSLFFRTSGLIVKFIFILFIFKFLSLQDAGTYGLIATTVILVVQFIGFDYYMHTSRELLKLTQKETISKFISEQFNFHFNSYILLLIPLMLIVYSDISNSLSLSFRHLIYIYFVIIFEHFNLEVSRIFNALAQPVLSNMIFFVQNSLWMLLFMLCSYFEIIYISLENIVFYWMIGAVATLFLSLYLLNQHYNKDIFYFRVLVLQNYKKLIHLSLPFFIGTIALKLIEMSDRFILNYYCQSSNVAELIFAQNLASIIQTVTVIGIISIYLPQLSKLYDINYASYTKKFQEMVFYSIILSILLLISLYILYPYVAMLTGKSQLINNAYLFMMVLLSNIFALLAAFSFYPLYFEKLDWYLSLSFIIGLVINLCLNFLLIPKYGTVGSVYSLIASYCAMITYRLLIINHIIKIKSRNVE